MNLSNLLWLYLSILSWFGCYSASIDDLSSKCKLPLIKGNCKQKGARYYFSSKKQKCLKYSYSECGGNGGFKNLASCQQNCLTAKLANVTKSKIDETPICDVNAGEYKNGGCVCKSGYYGNGFHCQDIDECSDLNNMIDVNCPKNSYCVNTIGSYNCECLNGFAGVAGNCTKSSDICYQAFDKNLESQCNDNLQWELRYTFSADEGLCKPFWFGGCQLGYFQNIHMDIQSCYSVCGNIKIEKDMLSYMEAVESHTLSPLPVACTETFDESRRDMCEKGNWVSRYYYDNKKKECIHFWLDESCLFSKSKNSNIFTHFLTCERMCLMTDSDISANGKNGGKKYGMLSATFTAFKGKNPNVEMRETFNQTTPPTIVNKAEEEYDVKNLHYASFKEGIDSKAKISVVIRNIESDRATHIRNTNLRNKLDKGQKYSERYHIPISVSMECLDPFDAKLAESCSTSVTEVQWKMKYYFDMNEGICKSYWNDGCKSTSKNTFEQNECEWKCLGKHPTPKFKSCLDKFDTVYLSDCAHGTYYKRYFFNQESKKCEMFYFGGCRSSSTNIFSDLAECQSCETPSREMTAICQEDFDTNYENSCSKTGLFSQYYYFDKVSLSCRAFWFGNCKGTSNNIFNSYSACEWLCIRKKDAIIPSNCIDKFDPQYLQSCGQHKWTQKYYFDHITGECQSFYYDGCVSTSTNFFNEENTCKRLCSDSSTAISQISNQMLFKIEDSFDSFRCLEDKDEGTCQDAFPAFFYNRHSRRCEPMTYSNCGKSANRFLTLQQCESSCAQFNSLTMDEMNCYYPLSVGHGRNEKECLRNAGYRFYYNQAESRCMKYWFFGCGESQNSFITYSTCELACSGTKKKALQVEQLPPVSACFEPIDKGNCLHNDDITSDRWAYNPATKKCQIMKFSGCGGTKNNFKSLLACSSTCKDFSPPNDKKCAYLPDWGPCNQLRYMWYFNMSSNSCEQFLYGNCGGNTNRFSTFETCQLTCEVPGEDICKDKLDRGRWCSSMSNRYYFNHKKGQCIGYHYTGCGISRNNFINLQDCIDVCIDRTRKDFQVEQDVREILEGDDLVESSNLTTLATGTYKGIKPREKQPMDRHLTLVHPNATYYKSPLQSADYGTCLGFRYNITGYSSRLNVYLCLMEENGNCEMQVLKHTNKLEDCLLMRPWLKGPHLYSWFFMLEKIDYKWSEHHQKPQLNHETVANILILPINDCFSTC